MSVMVDCPERHDMFEFRMLTKCNILKQKKQFFKSFIFYTNVDIQFGGIE